MMKLHWLSLHNLAWLLLIPHLIIVDLVECQIIDFPKTSFEIQSSLWYEYEKDDPIEATFKESYTNLQQRGRVDFSRNPIAQEDHFYIEASAYSDPKGIVLHDHNNNGNCREFNQTQFEGLFNLPHYLPGRIATASWIIGPARLLSFIQDHASDNYANNSLETDRYVVYEMDNQFTQTNQLRVRIYYSKARQTYYVQPSMLIIETKQQDLHQVLNISYSNLRILNQDELDRADADGDASDQEYNTMTSHLDQFALPIGGFCSKFLKSRREQLITKLIPNVYDLLQSQLPIQFSFRYQPSGEAQNYEVKNGVSIAYDSRLATLILNQKIDDWLDVRQIMQSNRIYYCSKSERQGNLVTYQKDDSLRKNISKPDQVLYGKDEFVYMGEARVRRLHAKVYEATGCNAPLWLTRSVPVKTKKDANHWSQSPRWSRKFSSNNDFTCLVYVAHETVVDGYQLSPRSILMFDLITPELDAYSFEFNDFSWNLPAETEDGDRSLNLFSIRSDASASLRSQVQLSLVSSNLDAWKPNERFLNRPLRNLGLFTSLSKSIKILPSVSVLDFSSKLVPRRQLGKELIVSFKLLDTSDRREMSLFELGCVSWLDDDDIRNKFDSIQDFPTCLALTTTLIGQQPIHIAYDELDQHCYILKPKDYLQSQPFGKFELFLSDQIENPEETKPPPINSNYLTGSKFSISDFSRTNKPLIGAEYVIDRVNVEALGLDNDQPFENFTLDSFTGFGLFKADMFTRSVREFNISLPHGTNKTVPISSIDDCRSLCLADLQCKAYSFCLRPDSLKCMLSKLSFRSEKIAQTFEQIAKENRKSMHLVFDLTIPIPGSKTDTARIKMERDSSCELHNRVDLDHFRQTFLKPANANLPAKIKVLPVGQDESVEICARRCFEQNLEMMRQKGESADTNETETRNERYIRLSASVCSNFKSIQTKTQSSNYNDSSIISTGSFCYFEKTNDLLIQQNESLILETTTNQTTQISSISEFKFKFEILYEKIDGVSLRAYQLDGKLLEAYEKLRTNSSEVDDEIARKLLAMDESGCNFQFDAKLGCQTEQECARYCFLQLERQTPWPICRSFDQLIDAQSGFKGSRFLLDSQTLLKLANSAFANESLDYEDKGTLIRLRRIHYEPKAPLMLMQNHLSLDFEEDDKSAKAWTIFDTIGVIIVNIIGALVAVFLSIKLTQFVIKRQRASQRRQSDCDRRQLAAGLHHQQHQDGPEI